MPIRQRGKLAMNSSSLARATSGAHQCRLACLVHTMHSKDVLRQIDSYGYDSHDFPSQSKLMKRFASPSWHFVAVNRNPHRARLAWDGEVPFIR